MSLGFITRVADWLRSLFGQKKRMENHRERESPVPVEIELPESVVTLDNYIQARRFLYKEGSPVGRLRSHRHPDIRCIPVRNFAEAYCFFIRLCDQRLIVLRQAAGILHYECRLADGTVLFDLTDRIRGKPQGTIAVLKINWAEFDAQIAEIEFVHLEK